MHFMHVPAFVRTSTGTGGWVTLLLNKTFCVHFLCTKSLFLLLLGIVERRMYEGSVPANKGEVI